MRPIQFILVALLIVILGMYFRRLHSRIFDRTVVLLLGIVGIVMALAPDLTTTVANLVGVGRGVDLITYMALVGLGFLCLVIYSELREYEQRLTDLARSIAIQGVREPKVGSDQSTTYRSEAGKQD